MVFQFFKGGESTIDVVEATLVQMVLDGRDVYDTAMEALFGGGKSKETKRELKTTDRGINTAQQDVRRDLMLHASVNDTVDLPLVLAYMSTVKDAERIGDYSKNFYDLVKYGADFEDAPDHELLADYRDRVSALLVRCGRNVPEPRRGTRQGPDRQGRRFPRRVRRPGEGRIAVDRSGVGRRCTGALLPLLEAHHGPRDELPDLPGAPRRPSRLLRRNQRRPGVGRTDEPRQHPAAV